MTYSLENAFDKWVNENPGNTAVSALEQLNDICSLYYIHWVTIDSVEYTGIKGGSKKAYGSGVLNVDLQDNDSDDATKFKCDFPFVFEFLIDEDGNIQKAEKLEIDLSNFYR